MFFLFHSSNICNFKLCIGLFSSFLVVSFFAFFYGSLSISGHPFDIVYTFVFFHFVHVRSTFSGYHYRYGMDGLYYQCQGMMKGIYSFNVPQNQLRAAHALLDKENLPKSMKLVDILHHDHFVVQ